MCFGFFRPTGVDQFLDKLDILKNEYYEIYRPEYLRIKKEAMEQKEKAADADGEPVSDDVQQAKKATLIEFGDHLPSNLDYEIDDSDNEPAKNTDNDKNSEEEEGEY